MVTVCWAVKGGSGTTVVTAALALSAARDGLLVDLDGELPAALGVPEPDRPGVADWLSSDASADQLTELVSAVAPGLTLLPYSLAGHVGRGDRLLDRAPPERWAELGQWLRTQGSAGVDVFVDAGTGSPPAPVLASADCALLVTRCCYLGLRRATRSAARPTGVVVVAEPGRALSVRDVEHSLGAPVVATVGLDPAVARAVDAGLLIGRPPRVLRRALRSALVA